MDWNDLRVFLAVAREGSISGAARRLSVQHSTVSRRMKALEETLGTRLIERHKTGYELTLAGEELKRSALRMERELLEFEGAMSGLEDTPAGELTVAAINNMASSVLMPIFVRFSAAYPEINLHVQVSNKYVSLAQRDADIAIRLTNTPAETLVGTRLVTVASTVYGRRDLVEAIAAGRSAPVWLGVECCGFHQSWTRAAVPDGDHRMWVDDTLLTLAAVRAGAGLAYLPCFMGDSDPALTRFAAPDPDLELGLWLLYHADLRRTQRVRLFREHMSHEMGAMRPLFEGERPARTNPVAYPDTTRGN